MRTLVLGVTGEHVELGTVSELELIEIADGVAKRVEQIEHGGSSQALARDQEGPARIQ
jgi:hypothetical protein